MKLQNVSLRSLQYFVDLVKYASYKEAAFVNGVTSSAVFQNIQGLEKALGFALLVRISNKIELTPDGRVFLARARATLEAFRLQRERPLEP